MLLTVGERFCRRWMGTSGGRRILRGSSGRVGRMREWRGAIWFDGKALWEASVPSTRVCKRSVRVRMVMLGCDRM